MAQPQLPSTLKEGFTNMPQAFRPERAAGVSAVIQFKVTGAETGNWVISVKDGACSVTEGEAAQPQRHHQHPLGRVAEDPPPRAGRRDRLHERPVHLHG